MQTMTRLTRNDLRELGLAMIVSNTPTSLFRKLASLPQVKELSEKCTLSELEAEFGRLAERNKRNEIELGLAYAILVAAQLTGCPHSIDGSILPWGAEITKLSKREVVRTATYSVGSKSGASFANESGSGI